MTAQVLLRLMGIMDHLRVAWQTGETLLESIPFSPDAEGTRYNVLLAVQEMLTNVLRHGYEGRESQPVEVEFVVGELGVTVVIRDCGPEFNPVAVAVPDLGENLPSAEGGYGIMIAKVVMDDLQYERRQGWNVLTMFKAINAPAPVLTPPVNAWPQN